MRPSVAAPAALSAALVIALLGAAGCAPARGDSSSPSKRPPSQHRPQATRCTAVAAAGRPNASWSGCKRDADCKEGRNGRCNAYRSGGHGPSRSINQCSYDACAADADCTGAKALCVCIDGDAGARNYCAEGGNCRVDGDCGAGRWCSPSGGGYYCHTANDKCLDDLDCAAGTAACLYQPQVGRWGCVALPTDHIVG